MGGAPSVRVGVSIGKYTLARVIGTGGMSTVYEATHRNGHRVALKVLKPALSVDAELRARFLREGYAANRVRHPGAVRVHDDETTGDGLAFLVMDLLAGDTVEALAAIAGGRLPLPTVLAIGAHLCEVLAAAHEAGVVHRDVKPANVFVCTTGELKVLDFGIARVVDPAVASATATGRMLGTPAFMSPEQAYGRRSEIDAKSDVWSAGATLFTILAGRNVHEAPSAEETLVKAATETAPPVATIATDVPDCVSDVLDRALAREKNARFADARAMCEALRAAYREVHGHDVPDRIAGSLVVGPAVATATKTTTARARTDGRARMFGALAISLAIGVGLAGAPPAARQPPMTEELRRRTPDPPAAAPTLAPSEIVQAPTSPPSPLAAALPSTSLARRVHLPTPRSPAVVAASPSAGPGAARIPPPRSTEPTSACFDYDEDGRKWPKRCP